MAFLPPSLSPFYKHRPYVFGAHPYRARGLHFPEHHQLPHTVQAVEAVLCLEVLGFSSVTPGGWGFWFRGRTQANALQFIEFKRSVSSTRFHKAAQEAGMVPGRAQVYHPKGLLCRSAARGATSRSRSAMPKTSWINQAKPQKPPVSPKAPKVAP